MNNKMALIGAASALALALSGCSDDDKTSLTSLVPKRITIEGTAARGAPIVGGEVRAQGANGTLSTIDITDDDGNYSITAIGLTPPIIVRVKNGFYDDPTTLPPTTTDPAGTQVAMLTEVVHNATYTMNLTPLTTLAMQQAAGQANLESLFGSWETTQPTAEELATAATVIRANLAMSPAAQAISGWATYDFFSTPFTADSVDPVDVLLDEVICIATAGIGEAPLQVNCTGLLWNPEIPTAGFVPGGAGTPVTGGGTGTITASLATPANGNGTLTLTGAEVSSAGYVSGNGALIKAEGDGFIVRVVYNTTTSTVAGVSYLWGDVNFDHDLATYVVSCMGTCGATVDVTAGTVTFASSALRDFGDTTHATLNGTIGGLYLTNATVPFLSGIAAVGAPISGGTVTATCAGATSDITVTTNADGMYSVSSARAANVGAVIPCALRVTATGFPTLYSAALSSGPSGSWANITPFTNLAMARAAANAGVDAWFAAGANFTTVTPAMIATATDAARNALTASAGVSVPFDMFTTLFSANGTSTYDIWLDSFQTAVGTGYAALVANFATNGTISGITVTLPGGGPVDSTCVATGTQGGTLTVSGSYSSTYTGTIAIPAQTSSFTGAAPCAAQMASVYGGQYAGIAGYSITTVTNTATNHTFSASFQSGGVVNYSVTYSYVMNASAQ